MTNLSMAPGCVVGVAQTARGQLQQLPLAYTSGALVVFQVGSAHGWLGLPPSVVASGLSGFLAGGRLP